jgi:hypothetical protein
MEARFPCSASASGECTARGAVFSASAESHSDARFPPVTAPVKSTEVDDVEAAMRRQDLRGRGRQFLAGRTEMAARPIPSGVPTFRVHSDHSCDRGKERVWMVSKGLRDGPSDRGRSLT